jgi:hypothetical protein
MYQNEEEDNYSEDNAGAYTDESTETEENASEADDPASYTVRMCSDYRVVRGKIKWRVSNINKRIRKARRHQPFGSPVFSVKDLEAQTDYKFRMAVYLKGVRDEQQSADHISVFLVSANGDCGVLVKYRFFLVGSDGRRHHRSQSYTSYFGDPSDAWGETELVPKSLLKEQNTRLLQGDSIVLACQLEIRFANDHVEGELDPRETRRARATLASSLYAQTKTGGLTDVVVICAEQRFPCHQTVLTARSDVFRAMFEHKDLIESIRGEIRVDDISPEAMEKMLEFMYLDSVAEVGPHAAELFVAADKYNITELKECMEDAMAKSLSVENVADVIILVHHHGCTGGLDKIAGEFAKRHMADVMMTESWSIIAKSYRTVADNLVQFPVDFSRKRSHEEVGTDTTSRIVEYLPPGNNSVRSLELLAKAASVKLD